MGDLPFPRPEIMEDAEYRYRWFIDIVDRMNERVTEISSEQLDHGSSLTALSLADDDHTHYHNDTRGDVRYLYRENTTSFVPDGDYEPSTKKYADDYFRYAFMMGST